MLTQKELKELLSYDKDTGIFKWKVILNNQIKIGETSGTKDTKGYIVIMINSKRYKAHRLAWLYIHGEFPKDQIDHINRARDDNRIKNIRSVNQSINMRNSDIQKNNKSGATGVYFNNKNKAWIARIGINNGQKHIGCFKLKSDAIKARKEAEILYGYL